jgi:hypothetical protein
MDRQGRDIFPEFVVNPVSPIRRVEKKGRKWRELPDTSWEEMLRENLEKVGVNPPEPPLKVEEFQGGGLEGEKAEEVPLGREAVLTIDSEEEFERVLDDIKKMADDPEKLVESHLKVFIEPVFNGKWVNSQG